MEEFSVEIEAGPANGEVIVTPAGELDLAAAPKFEAGLIEAESAAPWLIIVDMTGVGFIDSTGLRALLAAAGRAREGGWRFRISGPTEQVSKVLELTHSEAMFEIVP